MTDTDTAVPLRVRIESAVAWAPQPGDILDAHLVAVVKRPSEYGAYPVLILDRGDDLMFAAFHAFHSIARDKLRELKPARGERVVIAYPGPQDSRKRKDSKGNPVTYHPYIIYCPDRPAEELDEYDWDSDSATDTEPEF